MLSTKGRQLGINSEEPSCDGVTIEGYLDAAGNINTEFPKI